jgi:tetratricopeptide (TPR) repeat protein
MMRVPLLLVSGLLATVVTVRAHAADAVVHSHAGRALHAVDKCEKIDAAGTETAKTFYEAGRAYYDQGKLDKALDNFFSAYELDCARHDILIIISRTYQLDGNLADAIRTLEEYVRRSGDKGQEHRDRIANMKDRLQKEEATAAAIRANQKPPPTREHTIPPWILVGVGGAAIATGTVLAIVGYGNDYGPCDPDTLQCKPGATDAERRSASTTKSLRTASIVVLVSGAAVVAGGLLWHFLEPTGPITEKKAIRVTPAFGPGYAGATLDARF